MVVNINFKNISKSFGYKNYYFAKNNLSFNKNLQYFLKFKGPSFFEVHIRSKSIENLSRPKNLIKIKEIFIK